ncbi:MAG: asparagine synthase-related protein, partial [Vicinamibacterales bacterium]
MTGADTVVVPDAVRAKARELERLIAGFDSVIVAFSGGVDSAYLACTARSVLGPRALAVTAESASYPDSHRQLARRLAREFDLAHEVIQTGELARPEYRANGPDRCYH